MKIPSEVIFTFQCDVKTSSYDQFSWGDGSRGGSIRVPVVTKELGAGYLEDRRPAANIDPYLVSAVIVDVALLNITYVNQLKQLLVESAKPLA